ncbi:rhodanese-like domain-containing protein [Lacticigenium naphthae]|uniref:rhodanese-like domain-containing protein n=1 Tax=Lacticigenium naphthae TaxID=515351 RepID=UPI0004148178|nr:rhodanese-like domain-containing protein [Lacticigenium naphthae]
MYKSISVPELEQKLKKEEVVVLDVRETHEHQAGHIKGAQLLPLSGFPENINELNKDTEYHVICFTGSRSSMACEYLGNAGYNVVNVMGGMSAWRGETV